MKRIRKNAHRKIAAIAEGVQEITTYRLDNGFRGVSCPPREMYGVQKAGSVLAWIEKCLRDGDELTEREDGLYCLHVHSNLWFYLDLRIL